MIGQKLSLHLFKGILNPNDPYLDLRGKGFNITLSREHIMAIEKFNMYNLDTKEYIEYGTQIEMITGRLLHIYETYDEVMDMINSNSTGEKK